MLDELLVGRRAYDRRERDRHQPRGDAMTPAATAARLGAGDHRLLLQLLRLRRRRPGGLQAHAVPPNVRIIHTPCTGKIEMEHILEAFEKGIDGILVAGCLEGGCHFLEGNLRARKRTDPSARCSTRSAWAASGSRW